MVTASLKTIVTLASTLVVATVLGRVGVAGVEASEGVAFPLVSVEDNPNLLLERLRTALEDLATDAPPLVVEAASEQWSLDADGVPVEKLRADEEYLVHWRDHRWASHSGTAIRISDGVRLWDVGWRRRSLSAGPLSHQYGLVMELLLQRECFARWDQIPTLADELRECEVISIVETDGVIRCEYTLPRTRTVLPEPWRHIVVVDVGPPIRLVELSVVAWDPRQKEWRPPVRHRVTEWTMVAGRPFPRVVEEVHEGGDSVHRFVTRTARVPEKSEAADWTFAPPREPGWSVTDFRLRLEYVIGERIITVAGQRYRLAEPIFDHPGHGLAELLESAEALDGAAR